MEKENGNYRDSRGCIGIIEYIYWEKKMETTGIIGVV